MYWHRRITHFVLSSFMMNITDWQISNPPTMVFARGEGYQSRGTHTCRSLLISRWRMGILSAYYAILRFVPPKECSSIKNPLRSNDRGCNNKGSRRLRWLLSPTTKGQDRVLLFSLCRWTGSRDLRPRGFSVWVIEKYQDGSHGLLGIPRIPISNAIGRLIQFHDLRLR